MRDCPLSQVLCCPPGMKGAAVCLSWLAATAGALCDAAKEQACMRSPCRAQAHASGRHACHAEGIRPCSRVEGTATRVSPGQEQRQEGAVAEAQRTLLLSGACASAPAARLPKPSGSSPAVVSAHSESSPQERVFLTCAWYVHAGQRSTRMRVRRWCASDSTQEACTPIRHRCRCRGR